MDGYGDDGYQANGNVGEWSRHANADEYVVFLFFRYEDGDDGYRHANGNERELFSHVHANENGFHSILTKHQLALIHPLVTLPSQSIHSKLKLRQSHQQMEQS